MKYLYHVQRIKSQGPNKIFVVYVLFWILILNQNKTTATNGSLLVLFILIKILFRDYASKVTRIFLTIPYPISFGIIINGKS